MADQARKPPAILIGGARTALCVARSLSRAGVTVWGLGISSDPLRWSRHRHAFVPIRFGPEFQSDCMAWLESGPQEGVIMPCSDEGLELVARERSRLVELGYIPFEADDEVMLAMLDKERSYELARAAGIDAPRTAMVRSVEEAVDAAREIGFPVALKPRISHRYNHQIGGKAISYESEAELIPAVERTLELGVEMIVTEIIPGPDSDFVSYYGYIDESGESLLHVTKRKLRQYPTGFGLGTYHVTEWMPEVAEHGLRFLQGVGVRGYAGPEFKRDARDGRLKLIECNHRFTTITVQFVQSGADLPLFVYSRLAGLPAPTIDSYRQNLGLWLPGIDALAFLDYRRKSELTTGQWLRSLMRPQRFSDVRLSDPGPTLVNVGRRMRRLGEVPKLLRGR